MYVYARACASVFLPVTRQVGALEKRNGNISGPATVYQSARWRDAFVLSAIRETFATIRTRISSIRSQMVVIIVEMFVRFVMMVEHAEVSLRSSFHF